MKKGKIAELLALGVGGAGGFLTGGALARKVIGKNKDKEIYPMVTDYHIKKHPRLSNYIEKQIEKKASSSNLIDKIRKSPTSVKTIAGMAALGFGAGLPTGAFYNWKKHNLNLKEGKEFSKLDDAYAISNIAFDKSLSTIDALKAKRAERE